MKFGVIVNYNTKSPKSRTALKKAPKEHMNIRFDQLTKVLLSLSVMLMFTVALIAGQARANLPAELSTARNFALVTRMNITLDTASLQKIDSLLHVVDAVLALPIDIELGLDELALRTGKAKHAGSDDASVQ